jgi:hypothetical protein
MLLEEILELEEYIEELSCQYKLNIKEITTLLDMLEEEYVTKEDLYDVVLMFDA